MTRFFCATLAVLGLASTIPAYADPCSTSDLSLQIGAVTYNPATCANSLIATGGPNDEIPSLDSGLNQPNGVYLVSSDGDASSGFFQGIEFTLSLDPNKTASDGSWLLSWLDTNGANALNLPLTLNLEVGVYGGSTGAGYLLSNVLLPINPNDGTGSFDIDFVNPGGQYPAISHMDIAGTVEENVTAVPEPAALALMATWLLGLWVSRRRGFRAV